MRSGQSRVSARCGRSGHNYARTMAKRSAGLLLFRNRGGGLEVLLVHMGGPFWVHRDAGAWSLPKGEYESDEDPLAAARREFAEELGSGPPQGEALELGSVRQA